MGGVRIGTAAARIRYPDRDDVAVVELAQESAVAAVFTRNAWAAAPVQVARRHLAQNPSPRYLLFNSGNANAGLGERGIEDAVSCCRALAEAVQVPTEAVLPFSTGVIGERLPTERLLAALPAALDTLDDSSWAAAADAVMTTDTRRKTASRSVQINDATVTLTAFAKGAGMIRPDMATMLAFLATDAAVAPPLLQAMLEEAVANSFNCITVDGDTSTNDACLFAATGTAIKVEEGTEEAKLLAMVVQDICQDLALQIVQDGEGATRLLTVQVSGAGSKAACKAIARSVAESLLVKTAVHAGDPNWGRILAAAGRAPVENIDWQRAEIYLGDACVVRNGARADDYTEEQGKAAMQGKECKIRIKLGPGKEEATVWSSDLSEEYVRINASYRS